MASKKKAPKKGKHVALILVEGETEFEFYTQLSAQKFNKKPKKIKVLKEYLYLGEVEDMNAAIMHGQNTYISLEESRNHVKTVLSLYESAKLKKRIFLK